VELLLQFVKVVFRVLFWGGGTNFYLKLKPLVAIRKKRRGSPPPGNIQRAEILVEKENTVKKGGEQSGGAFEVLLVCCLNLGGDPQGTKA